MSVWPRPRVAVDFDGVLHEYHGWTGPSPEGEPLPGAQAFIQQLIDDGFEPFVYTARVEGGEPRRHVYAWLSRHGFPQMHVLEKPTAVAYIDDRAVHCDPAVGAGFDAALARVRHMALPAAERKQASPVPSPQFSG